MNRLLLLSITLVILTTSCTSKYAIKGNANLNQLSGKTIYLKSVGDNSSWVTIDSAQIIHGEFQMRGKTLSTPQMVTLFMDQTPLTPLVLEPGNINISITSSGLTIHGTPLNNKLYSFYEENQALERQLRENTSFACEEIHHSFMNAHQSLIREFMNLNQDNILAPTIYSIYQTQYPELFNSEYFQSATSSDTPVFNDTHLIHQFIKASHFKENYPNGFFLW